MVVLLRLSRANSSSHYLVVRLSVSGYPIIY